MLNIFVEANCNRYVRDECQFCHVYEPLSKIDRSGWYDYRIILRPSLTSVR